MAVDEVGQVEVKLTDGYIDVVGVDAEAGVGTFGRLLQPLTVCALQWDRLEEYHHHQVQAPNLQTKLHSLERAYSL